jgi:hypothetical protein
MADCGLETLKIGYAKPVVLFRRVHTVNSPQFGQN